MTSWSYSSYSAAVKCLRYYKYVYIDRLVPEVPESGDLVFGSALHSAINAILTGDSGEDIFNIYWDSYKDKEITYGRFKWQELKDLGLNFCSKFKRLHAPKYKIHQAEVRLYAEYKGIKFEGTPDFIGEYNGSTSLRDFKTSGYNYDKSKDLIATQLYLYAYLYLFPASRRSSTGPITLPPSSLSTLGYTVFNKGTGSIQDMTWEFREEDMYHHLDNLVEYCQLVDSQNSFPKQANSCIMGSIKCNFFDKCWKREIK